MVDVLFINAMKKPVLSQEVNGTLLLATKLLEADFSTQVLRFGEIGSYHKDYTCFIGDITREILHRKPRCVSFYLLWPHTHIMLRIARELKAANPEIITVFGGPQASATAEATLAAFDYVDYVCIGEGENTVVPFFTALLREPGTPGEQLPGLCYRENGTVKRSSIPVPLCDLETLPQWDDRLLTRYLENPEPDWSSDSYFMALDVGRGCPFNCTFCSSSYFWRRRYRLKSPKRIVEDMLYHYHKYGMRSFAFSHDAFTINMKMVDQICDEIIATGIDFKWYCSTRFNCLSRELLLKMKRSGLMRIELGIETGSERMQKLTKKNLDLSQVRELVDFMLKSGIRVGVFFMFGFPEETEEDLAQTLDMMFSMLDAGVHYTSLSLLRFNPASELTVKYFDQLVMDPSIKSLKRGIYGYDEEAEVIAANKAVFPFYYHLDTPLRREFQYLPHFNFMYQRFPRYIRYIRRLYNGDNLQFYRDFCRNNPDIFALDMMDIERAIHADPVQMLCNGIRDFDVPYLPQLRSALQFELDLAQVRKGPRDMTLSRTYSFRYPDVQARLPIEAFSKGETDILFHKAGGVLNIVPVHIR